MNTYFFSYLPCGLKINGKYFGEINSEPRLIPCFEQDLIEFLPLNNNFLPNIATLKNIIEKTNNICCHSGLDLFYIEPTSFCPFPKGYNKVLEQKLSQNLFITIIVDASTKFILQNNNYVIIEPLPFTPTEIKEIFCEKDHIGLTFKGEKSLFELFSLQNGITKILSNFGDFSFNSPFATNISTLPTLLCHEKTTKIDCFTYYKQVSFLRNKKIEQISNEILKKFAFLECISLKDNVKDLLNDELQKISGINEFFGDFSGIFISPNSKYDFVLTSNKLKFVKLEMQNNVVSDIILD